MLFNDPLLIRILVKGKPLELPSGSSILGLSYEDVEKGDDLLTVSFSDPFNKLIDSKQLRENTEWQVQWGFPRKMHAPRKVLVKRPRFRHGEVEIEGLSKGSMLRVSENWNVASNKTSKAIVEEIASRHQLSTSIDDDLLEIIPFIAFGGRTDYQILEYLQSRAANHVFKVINDTLFFEKRQLDAAPVGTFEYAPGRDSRLISFEISVKDQDNAKSAQQTTTVSVDPLTFKRVVFKADESTTASVNLGNRRPQENYVTDFKRDIASPSSRTSGGTKTNSPQGESTGKSLPVPAYSLSEAAQIARGRRNESLLDSIEANFEIVASPDDPFYKSGDIIEIRNIGKTHSGKYRIIEITHDLNEGYFYKIKAKRNATGGGDSALNGTTNTKKPKLKFTKVDLRVLGSESGAAYGNNGRVLE